MALLLLNPAAMTLILRFFSAALVAAAGLMLTTATARAVTMEELRATESITPERFARFFADFEFKFHEEVQDWNAFLKTRSGDCDDYATLAADVLRASGYTPRLFAVRMKGETHVICYIPETGSYLDYNYRNSSTPLLRSDGSLTDIARRVSATFGRDWLAVYEFTFCPDENVKRLATNILHNRGRRTS